MFGFFGRRTEFERLPWETEDRLISILRIFLGLSAQLVIIAHPEEFISESVFLTSSVIDLYILFAIWQFLQARRENRFAAVLRSGAHWVDVAWCLGFMSVSRGAESSYFIGLLFPIVVSAFRWGFVSALRVTLVSVLGFAAISAISFQAEKAQLGLNLIIVRLAWLLIAGYLLGYWGELEIRIRRRLDLISRLTGYANPRFGIDRTVTFILERLKDFYQAQFSLMVLADADGNGFRILRTGGQADEGFPHFTEIAPEIAHRLMGMSPDYAAVQNARREELWSIGTCTKILDVTIGRMRTVESFDDLAGILDARSFVTVPVHYRSQGIGRLYIVAKSPVFVPSDMRFLLQVLDHVNPIMENIRLIEQLAEHAAEEERRKIARDIHDSALQPYIGLQLGLAAIRKEMGESCPHLSLKLDKLMEMTAGGIGDLRRYALGLKEDETDSGLLAAMRRFAATFTEATGILIDIDAEGDPQANVRLAAEVFQMMTEGLSNIRKHTQSVRAKVRLICRLGHLILEITNDGSKGGAVSYFVPASITERAAAMGGKVRVRTLPDRGTSVIVDIPL